jgi:hypothetical protein
MSNVEQSSQDTGHDLDDDWLAVGFPAVADTIHAHDTDNVSYLVNDAIIADANAPIVSRSGQLSAAKRARVHAERLNRFTRSCNRFHTC